MAVVLLASFAIACSKDAAPPNGTASRAKVKTDDSAAGSVDLGGPSYTPAPMAAVGSLSGTIKLDGVAPPDSMAIAVDEKVCGTKAESPVATSAKGLAGVVVWIADAKTGKELPMDKRSELASEKCALSPRVQGVVVGTTMNVFNDDKALHRLVFIHTGTHDTLAVMPFFNEGQIVASERLAKTAGVVEIHCALHSWTRGYIAVFDHPYFAVTEKDGDFKIDSLPPGKYTVNVWHEGMAKPVAQQVQIDARGAAKLDLAIKLP